MAAASARALPGRSSQPRLKRTLVLSTGIRWVTSPRFGCQPALRPHTIPLSIVVQSRYSKMRLGRSTDPMPLPVSSTSSEKKDRRRRVNGYVGEYSKGGRTTERQRDGPADRPTNLRNVCRELHTRMRSALQVVAASFPEPGGPARGSSAPQDAFLLRPITRPCRHARARDAAIFRLREQRTTTRSGTRPIHHGTYHNWSDSDRFNLRPKRVLTRQRKAYLTNSGVTSTTC